MGVSGDSGDGPVRDEHGDWFGDVEFGRRLRAEIAIRIVREKKLSAFFHMIQQLGPTVIWPVVGDEQAAVLRENRLAVERHRLRQLNRQVAEIKELGTLAEKIRDYSATIEANANADGHLYGSVGEAEISKVLNEAGLPVEPEV